MSAEQRYVYVLMHEDGTERDGTPDELEEVFAEFDHAKASAREIARARLVERGREGASTFEPAWTSHGPACWWAEYGSWSDRLWIVKKLLREEAP